MLKRLAIIFFSMFLLSGCNLNGGEEQTSIEIRFYSFDNQLILEESIQVGSNVQPPNPPLREGYTFTGWDHTLNDIQHTIDVRPLYERNRYQISFNLGDYDGTLESQTIVHGETLNILNLERPHHRLEGWYFDAEFEDVFSFDTPIRRNQTLYARWEANTYQVSFSEAGNVPNQEIIYQGQASEPTTPSKDGHTFVDWVVIGSNEPFDFSSKIESNVALEARWEPLIYEIIFVNEEETITTSALHGTLLSRPTLETKTGKVFMGWYLDEEGESLFNFSTFITQPKTLYAQWEWQTYRVRFVDGGDIPMQRITHGQQAEAPLSPTREGYTFLGWYRSSDGELAFDFDTSIEDHVTLTAKWQIIEHQLTFNFNYSGQENVVETLEHGTIPQLPSSPDRDFYQLTGWYIDQDLTEPFELSAITQDKIAYAKWEIIEGLDAYPVYFENTNLSSTLVDTGSTIVQPSDPTRDGHTFKGWFTDNSFSTPFDFNTVEVTTITRVYAKWEIHTFTVNFRNGGDIDPIVVNYNQRLSLPATPQKTGHIFEGWYLDAALTERFDNRRIQENLTLYAGFRLQEYRVDYRGADAIPSVFVEYQQTISEFPTPTREGHTFLGWFTSQDFTTRFFATSQVTENLTLYAQWQINQYTIRFSGHGGTATLPITQDYNSLVTAPTAPTREGHEFIGWYLEETYETPYVFNRMGSEDIRLHAKWQVLPYTLSFETGEGTALDDITLDFGSNLSIEVPQRAEYVFSGWYLDEELTQAFTSTTMPAEDLTLYAKWKLETFTITFDSQGGTVVDDIVEAPGEPLSTIIDPTKEGHTFLGWYTSEEALEPYVFTTMPEEDIQLTARWEINAYTISFESHGGDVIDAITEDYGTTLSAPEDPTKEGHTFKGWFVNEGLTESYAFTTMPAEDLTLHAKWDINEYTISFVTDGDSIESVSFLFGDTIFLETPSRDNYLFEGWYLDASFNESFTLDEMPSENITLYVKWSLNTLTIQFNLLENEEYQSQVITFGDLLETPTTPTRAGFIFEGWYVNLSFEEALDFSVSPTESMTVYAKWEEHLVTITFESNGGTSVSLDPLQVGSVFTPPTEPTRVGHTFRGWYLEGSPYVFEMVPDENLTLSAQWDVNSYTLTFESNGGTAVSRVSHDFNTEISAPTAPTRQGYAFSGWFIDEDLTERFEFNLMPAQNVQLYAKWSINSYTISFLSSGGSSVNPINQEFNTVVEAPADPTREGYTFLGWFTSTEATQPYEFTTMPAQSLTLTARWQINQYTITFESRAGSAVDSITQDFNTSLIIEEPTRAGFVFKGWYTNTDFTTEFTKETMPAQDLTLYAKWEIEG